MQKAKFRIMLLTVALVFALASSAFADPSIWFTAVGASAQFKTWGLGTAWAMLDPNVQVWSVTGSKAGVDDTARNVATIQKGDFWVIWKVDEFGVPTDIACYVTVDSTVGVRAMFAAPRAKLWLDPGITTIPGSNLVSGFRDTVVNLPAAVYDWLVNREFDLAFSEVAPEDAKHATALTLAKYGSVTVKSSYSSKEVQAIDFNILGQDPLTGANVPTGYQTRIVGASPIIVFVSDHATGAGHLGEKGSYGEPLFQNINSSVLAGFYDGSFSLTRDIIGDSSMDPIPVTSHMREPLSGTYNTFEYTIPASVGIGSSQENGITSNPLNYPVIVDPSHGDGTTNGARKRVIGTGEMVSKTIAVDDSMGYSFWGYGNFNGAFGTTHYLAVDGVDPLLDSYWSYGFYPNTTQVTMKNVKNGSYPIWGYYHAVLDPLSAAGAYFGWVESITETILPYVPEFVSLSEMTAFRSHFTRPETATIPHNGNIPGLPAAGGDVGGRVYTITADQDYFAATGMELLERHQ
jgi:hypothetical protein